MTPVLLDVESRSRADLKSLGGRRYWEHPSSEVLCIAWYDTRDDTRGVWTPGAPWPHEGRVLAAHNAHGFDRHALARYGITAAAWIDTSQLARKAGLRGALDVLGERWCGIRKDKEASRFTVALSSVRRPTKRTAGAAAIDAATWREIEDERKRELGVQPEITPDVLARVVTYCESDVEIMVRAWPRLQEWIAVDAAVEALDERINARGVCFDSALAQLLIACDERNAADTLTREAAALAMPRDELLAIVRSPAQLCALAGLADATADTVKNALDRGDAPACVLSLCRARQALATIARGKLEAGLARVHADGRLRDTLRYYGAHTGRWSGQGMQLHNLPRPAARFEGADVDAIAASVLAGESADSETVALLVRATLTASPGCLLVAQDFASVEARCTAWAAGDSAAVDVFRSGRDPYKVAATAVFGCAYDDVSKPQRQIGKVCELALGYQGGTGAFRSMAKQYKLGPDALAGLDLDAIVQAWRTLHAPIRSLWYASERAFRAACAGRAQYAGPFEYVPATHGDAVACFLPSGRPIVYQGAAASDDGCTYEGTRGHEHTYGGKLVENAIQALCRDLLCGALLAAEAAGLNPVLHVHDEIVCDVPEAAAEAAAEVLHAVMLDLPPWAAGFPIGADGWIGRRYHK